MKNRRANKGQFSVIAALLVSVILVTAVISTYTLVRHAPIQDSPKVLSAMGEMNSDIKQILDFTVGYYGSILQVTGNSTYARNLTRSYLSSGLVNIARSHPEWNPSFTLDFDDEDISTCWFMPESYSKGRINLVYSLASLGIEGVNFTASSALKVEMLNSSSGVARINVTRDNTEPELGLSKENFWFYSYTEDSTWELVNPNNIAISSNGVYTIPIPSGVDPDVYSVQVKDNRGIMVSAFYSEASVAEGSKIPHYTYTFDWESTGMLDIYESLSTDTFVIELLQNGTLRWLGQPLEVTPNERPIPPICIKAFRVNATIAGNNHEVPFQVEDWASNYMVPLGLASNESIFSNNNMLVFLVNNEVSEVTLWWDGNDTAIQTSYAWENRYFTDSVPDRYTALLSNGILSLSVRRVGSPLRFVVTSTVGGSTSTAEFLRINKEEPVFWAETAYVIINGVVRDIIQQEPEYSGGVQDPDCPNFYTQIVLTLPANATYYTYSLRTIFVDSANKSRTVEDLSVVQLSGLSGSPMTENGTIAIYPNPSNSTGAFSDCSPTGWDHHWSQFVSETNTGAGVMFTDSGNEQLYAFDSVAGNKTGALVVYDGGGSKSIEVNPVELNPVSFDTARDLTWYGAVVTFSNESIYHGGDDVGLWVMVEHPPAVVLDGNGTTEGNGIKYVNTNLSNVDSSADKGTHSAFSAQKYGPDSIVDTLTEANTGGGSGYFGSSTGTSYTTVYANRMYGSVFTSPSNAEGATLQNVIWYGRGSSSSGNAKAVLVLHSTMQIIAISEPVSFTTATAERTCTFASPPTLSANTEYVLMMIFSTDTRFYYSSGSTNQGHYDTTNSYSVPTDPTDATHNNNRYRIRAEYNIPNNYELDLEVQWTHANFGEANAELCIYLGEFSGENLNVDVWTGSGWTNLFSGLNVGWNNVTVSSYLTSPIFTIRFIGATETGDTTQDYWTIDATLLHCWS